MINLSTVDLDFKLLLVFQVLIKTRKVSDTAEQLGVSQPTVSRSLARLREHFSDPLFVRAHYRMEPTPCAIDIAPVVDEMLNIYYSRLSQQYEFDPKLSSRTFSIAASEIGHLLLLPKLVNAMKSAPNLTLKAIPLGLHSLIEELETGVSDIAFGAYPKLYAGVYERTVAQETYVCVVRGDHPRIKDKLSLDEYQRANHVIVSAKGLGHIHEQIEKQLFDTCSPEQVLVVSHHFLTTLLLVEQTDLVVTLPLRAVAALEQRLNIKTFQPPIEIPSFDIKIYWHERFHREPANQWLRNLVGNFFVSERDLSP